MPRSFLTAALLGVAAFAVAVPVEAGGRAWTRYDGGLHPKSSYYRAGPRVRQYVARRGGYSYVWKDVINTYGDARGRYGAANSFRDPQFGRQTVAGPFDHGFFFDSGIGPHGGDAPYMH